MQNPDKDTVHAQNPNTEQADPSDDFDIQPHMEALKPLVDQFRRGFFSDSNLFESVVRASFAKCFDYAEFAHSTALTVENAFYSTGTLRSVCEDLIVLRYLRDWEADQRNRVIRLELELGFDDQVRRQEAFFSQFRYGQQVLSGSIGREQVRHKAEELNALWRRNGFPNEERSRPRTEQVARKVGTGALSVLYEYIFRITSETVHFNVRALLRTGWGNESESGDWEISFSPSNMGRYELAFCKIYSTLLLTIYFEFFPTFFAGSGDLMDLVQKLRRALTMVTRWPEMVTFEELNRSPPKGREIYNLLFQSILADKFENGFIAGAEPGEQPDDPSKAQ
jgi:hypothetical protein